MAHFSKIQASDSELGAVTVVISPGRTSRVMGSHPTQSQVTTVTHIPLVAAVAEGLGNCRRSACGLKDGKSPTAWYGCGEKKLC